MCPPADSHLSRAKISESSIFSENRQELWRNGFGLRVIGGGNNSAKITQGAKVCSAQVKCRKAKAKRGRAKSKEAKSLSSCTGRKGVIRKRY